MLLNPGSEVTGALDVINDLAARVAREYIFSKEHHLTVWKNHLTIFSNHA